MFEEVLARCETDTEQGLDVTLDEFLVFVGEIQGREDGKNVYCTLCWTPFMPEIYSLEVTSEPIFPYLVDPDLEDDSELVRVRRDCTLLQQEVDEDYDGPYAEQFRKLLRMVNDKAVQRGFRVELFDNSDYMPD